MRITKEAAYIMTNEDGMKALAPDPGEYVELELADDTYRAGQISEVSEQGITLIMMDGRYSFDAGDIEDYKSCGTGQEHTDSIHAPAPAEQEQGPTMSM